MYCTNLNFKALNEAQIASLQESNEIIGSEWEVFNFKQSKGMELKPIYKFKFYQSTVQKLNMDGIEMDEYNWNMNEF